MLKSRKSVYCHFKKYFTSIFDCSCMQLWQTKVHQQGSQSTTPTHTHTQSTESTQPQAKFFQCQLQHQNDKIWWFFFQENILYCLGRGTKQQVAFVFSHVERSQSPVLQLHMGFFPSVECNPFLWQSWYSSTVCTLWLGRQNIHPAPSRLPLR